MTLEQAWEAARTAHPDIAVGAEEFAAEVARRVGDGALEKHSLDDVYVAIAAARGDVRAIALVEEVLAKELAAATPRTGARPDQVTDAHGAVRELLFTSTAERTAALTSFGGRGGLRGFVRVIATRELIKIVQKGRREAPHEGGALLALLSSGGDPELSLLKERYRDGVTACVRTALGKLGDRERALLQYQLVDGWSADRVGALYGVHRATAARWIAAAREQLGELIRAEVVAQLAIALDEVDSIVRLVQSRVELSLARLISQPVDEP